MFTAKLVSVVGLLKGLTGCKGKGAFCASKLDFNIWICKLQRHLKAPTDFLACVFLIKIHAKCIMNVRVVPENTINSLMCEGNHW